MDKPAKFQTVDPVLATVIENRLSAIATQMAETMLLTSRSLIFQALDFVTGIFTAEGEWVATKDYIPVLAGSLPSAYEAVARKFKDDVHDGDIFILNDVYHGNNHPPDVTILKPVFHRGTLRFWSVTKGHNADVGGGGVAGYNPYARDVWDDSIRIPPVRVWHKGVLQVDVWELILHNIPLRRLVQSDLECQIGAAEVGARELIVLLDTFGVEPVQAAISHFLNASRLHMEDELRKIPNGTYRAVRWIDDGGAYHRQPIAFRLTLIKDGPRVTLDFRDSDPQVTGYANSTLANTVSSALIGIFGVVDPALRRNSGSIAPIRVLTAPGTIAHAVEPAATTLCTLSACEAIVESIWMALGEAAPQISNAGWSHNWIFSVSGVSTITGRQFAAFAFTGGGGGATEGYDGWDSIGSPVSMGGLRGADIEILERNAPCTVLHSEFRTDSGGSGQWRGGLGSTVHWRVDQDDMRMVSYGSGGQDLTAPFGLLGGQPAPHGWAFVHYVDGRLEDVELNTILRLNKGDIVEIQSSGGGGFGDPFLRPAALVAEDLRNGAVSAEAAREMYGVVFEAGAFEIDHATTEAHRARRKTLTPTTVRRAAQSRQRKPQTTRHMTPPENE